VVAAHRSPILLEWELGSSKLRAGASLFRTDKTNDCEPDPSNPLLNVLCGNQRMNGFEGSPNGALSPFLNAPLSDDSAEFEARLSLYLLGVSRTSRLEKIITPEAIAQPLRNGEEV
jgi:hypothetical protein